MKFSEKEKKTDYQNRINRVFKYISENLEADLSLNTISDIAFFSTFHFHRIFKSITKETLNGYITRQRIEKSAADLIHKSQTIIEISHKYGFNDNATFTRTFKKYYGISPTEFKKTNPYKFSKISQLKSKNGQEYPNYQQYICILNNLKNWVKMNAKIEIKEISKINLAYVSSIGIQNIENAYQKLIQWATPHGLMHKQTKMLSIYHDSFKITEVNKIRMSACIILNKPIITDGEIMQTSIDKGKFIVGSFEIRLNEFEKSWTGLFLWMHENGYKKSERNPFEIYHTNFKEHPDKKCLVYFYIPIL